MKKGKIQAIVGIAAVAMLAACSGSGGSRGPGGEPIEGGDFHVAWEAQPDTLDPGATTAGATTGITLNIFEGLVTLDENNRPQPLLAESFEASPDNTRFDFTLRTDVTFHNGQEMTTEDVIASTERWIADSGYGQQFFVGAQVTSPSENVVQVATPKPLYTGLLLMADLHFAVMPASVIAEKGPSGVKEIFGTGPYKFAEWKKDQYVKLEKFADYKSPPGEPSALAGERKPIVDNLYYDIVPDAAARLSGLQTGQYELANLSLDQLSQVENDENLTTSIEPLEWGFLVFNKKEGLMSNVAMRKAVQAAIDVDAIGKAVYGSDEFYELDGALSLPSQTSTYTTVGTETYDMHDLEKARQYLREAGYNGEPVRFLTTHEYGFYNYAVVLQQQLKAVGVKIDLVVTDWATLLENRADPGAWELFVTSTNFPPTSLAQSVLYPTWPGWTDDPAIEQAMTAINASTSEEEAKTHYGELQRALFVDYVAMVKFVNGSVLVGAQKSIGGYYYYAPYSVPILYNAYKTQ